MKRLESFLIFVHNLSDVYIFTVVTVISVAAVAFYCAKIMNKNLQVTSTESLSKRRSKKKDKNSDTEDENNGGDDNLPISDKSEHSSCDDDDLATNSLVREIKSAQLKEIEKKLTDEQIKEERRVENQQLAAIYELLKKQEEELKTSEIDENEFKKQLKLYR